MLQHGDDIFNYNDIRYNLSSNVYNGFDHNGLYNHLAKVMTCIANYPEPTPMSLEVMIAEHLGVSADNVMVTNGATEAIYLIAQSYRGCRSHIFQPTFGEYAEACQIHKHEIVNKGEDVTWLCNPNNPTGEVIPKELLLQAIHNTPDTTFVIDQSYDRFTLKEMMTANDVVAEHNVIVLHSMTKEYAIPGLRLGYVVGNATLLNNIRQHRMPWSVNSLAIEAGKYLVEHDKEYKIDVAMLISEAQRVAAKLRSVGIKVTDSDTHILLCQLPDDGIIIKDVLRQPQQPIRTAAELKSLLATQYGILIRDASNFETLTPQHFRIAVQDAEKNDAFLTALAQ